MLMPNVRLTAFLLTAGLRFNQPEIWCGYWHAASNAQHIHRSAFGASGVAIGWGNRVEGW